MSASKDLAALVGRILLGIVFIPAGFGKIGSFSGTAGYIASKGLPLPEVGAALALAVFTLAATVFFHAFWAVPPEQQMTQQLMFMKNIGIVGGLLAFYAFGAGRISIDKQ